MTQVRQTGNWEAWLEFYLEGVKETAEQAVNSATQVLALFEEDRKKIQGENATLIRVFQHAHVNPYMQIPATAKVIGVTYPPVAAAMVRLSELGIVKEVTGRRRGRIFCYQAYLRILSEGTESLR